MYIKKSKLLPEHEYIKLKELINQSPKSHSKFALLNSYSCIERAWQLKKRDPNAAYFLLITAEEEASTSILLALKELKYSNANKLKHRDHFTKTALYVFYHQIYDTLKNYNLNTEIERKPYENQKYPRIEILYKIKDNGTIIKKQPKLPFLFPPEIDIKIRSLPIDLKTNTNFNTIKKHIEQAANRRNEILYACDKGILQVKSSGVIKAFSEFKLKVAQYSMIYLCIKPYKYHQPFIQELLDTFIEFIELSKSS